MASEQSTNEKEETRAVERKPVRIPAERNLEKWPAIWQPARANTKFEARHFTREYELADGKQIRAEVKVGFTDEGTLTTEDQKTYYALVKHWYESNQPGPHTPFSIRKLAKLLKKKGWGTNVIDAITESLSRLRVTPLTWKNSYIDGASGETIEEMDKFNILSELKIVRRKSDGQITHEAGYYAFNDFITKNLLAKHTKPVLFDTILDFKSDIAQLLYTHLDLMLFNKSQYERRTAELFDDLGLRGPTYKHASNRKQKLIRALKELRGVRLTSGWISEVFIERTRDRGDYKIIVRKAIAPNDAIHTDHDVDDATTLETLSQQKDELTVQAEQLVKLFHQSFHGVEAHTPQTKEVNQAISLVTTLGFDKARYVVEFSRDAASETRYKPQTFGGILQYASRGAARFDEEQAKRRWAERRREKEETLSRMKNAYDAYVRAGIDAYLADPKHQVEIDASMSRHLVELGRTFPGMPPHAVESLARHAVRSEVARKLAIITFDEFVVAERAIAAAEHPATDSGMHPEEGSATPEADALEENGSGQTVADSVEITVPVEADGTETTPVHELERQIEQGHPPEEAA